MKKLVLLLGMAVMISGVAVAKDKKKKKKESDATEQTTTVNTTSSLTTGSAVAPAAPAAPAVATIKADDIAYGETVHDFGTVEEGPDATTQFTFVNNSKEDFVIQKAQASCGCTVPSYSTDPVHPGAKGVIDVAFHTKGKPAGPFTKTVTVTSNAGVKVLTIKGSVEKAPATSVPENTSMLKIN